MNKMYQIFKYAFFTCCLFASSIFSIQKASADKGMWLLNELSKQNIETLRQLGFKLPIDSLYSLDKPSIANAVVIFGPGCTGVTVSNEGLIFTNHHCGYESIQSQSSVKHDYLKDGFVSHDMKEEIPISGLTVKYLHSIKDVTVEIMKGVTNTVNANNIEKIQTNIEEYTNKLNNQLKSNFQEVVIVPYYQYNKFYQITYDVFKDVRMVFAPPSCLGKFGGDTDNWMWPRQTCDFSVFRVYASKDNKPADYSKDNVPYHPKYHAVVSLKGYQPNSFAMTIGYPGSTERYIPSWGIVDLMKNSNNPRIYIRGIKQDIWKKAMDKDQATRIKYDAKFAQSANYWKNAQGMNLGIRNLNVIGKKQEEEAAFQAWADKPENAKVYAQVLPNLKKLYSKIDTANHDLNYLYEALFNSTDLIKASSMFYRGIYNKDEAIKKIKNIYKDISLDLDETVFAAMLKIIENKLYDPTLTYALQKQIDEHGNIDLYTNYLYKHSIFTDSTNLIKAIKDGQTIDKDPFMQYTDAVFQAMRTVFKDRQHYMSLIEDNLRLYFKGRHLMDPNRPMPSDANFTMRMSYGTIKGYSPADAVWYRYFTTPLGLLQKNQTGLKDYFLLPSVLKLIKENDWGQYKDQKDGLMHTCFLSNNDITGGNSGSPVFNGNGQLIGLAFDGNWEAMSGDIEFEPNLQRTICVDIRYVLWTIDKWGKCPRLIKELSLR